MVHPFEEILTDSETDESRSPEPNRRGVLKLAVGGAAAVLASKACGQVATTLAIGEEGGKGKPPRRPPVATTKRVGEEGGKPPAIIGPTPPQRKMIATYCRDFRVALKGGDVETAADSLNKLKGVTNSTNPRNPYKRLVSGYRRQLDTALTGKLKRADKDLSAKKPIPAIKAYRAVSRVNGFDQQEKAKAKLADAEKLDGYKDALSEVQAQELYDTAAKAKDPDKLLIYQQVAKEYGATPTGKKADKQAKELAKRLDSDEKAAAAMLAKAQKAKGSTKTRMLKAIATRYPQTSAGKTAAGMLPPKKAPRPKRPRPGGGPIATTMAIGEEG